MKEIQTFVTKSEKSRETLFTIHAPPHVGYYKLEIFAAAVPRKRGKLSLPIVAIFMLQVKLKPSQVGGLTTSTQKGVHKLSSLVEPCDNCSDSGGMYLGLSPGSSHKNSFDSTDCFITGLHLRNKQDRLGF